MNLQRNRTRHFYIVLSTALLLSLTGLCGGRANAASANKKAIQKTGEAPHDDPQSVGKQVRGGLSSNDQYIIGTEDVLQINVWHEPEISSLVSVRPDGKISIALVGDLTASGLTPSSLQSALTEKLRAYISNPEVSVTMQQIKSKNFNILGEVQRPGSYPLVHSIRVLDAIGLAGGFRDFAKSTKIYVLRRTSTGEIIHIPFNYKQVIKGAQDTENVELKPEDTVIVP